MEARDNDKVGKLFLGAGILAAVAAAYAFSQQKGGIEKATTALKTMTKEGPLAEAKEKLQKAIGEPRDIGALLRNLAPPTGEQGTAGVEMVRQAPAKFGDLVSTAREKASSISGQYIAPAAVTAIGTVTKTASEAGDTLSGLTRKQTSRGMAAMETKAEDIRSSISQTMRNIETGAGEAVHGLERGTMSLAKTLTIGSLLLAMVVYIYAPEREKQTELFNRVKGLFSGLRSTVNDLSSR